MAEINFDHHAQFFTATILEWKHLLKDDTYKDIVIDTLRLNAWKITDIHQPLFILTELMNSGLSIITNDAPVGFSGADQKGQPRRQHLLPLH